MFFIKILISKGKIVYQDIKNILDRIKKAYNVQTYKELAEVFNIKYSTIDNWKLRKKIPEKYIVRAAQDCDVEIEWIKEGKSKKNKENSLITINNKLNHFPLKAVVAFIYIIENNDCLHNKKELFNAIENFYSSSPVHIKSIFDFTSTLDKKALYNSIQYFLFDEDIAVIFDNKNYFLEVLNYIKASKNFI